jgi:hypothetical protein
MKVKPGAAVRFACFRIEMFALFRLNRQKVKAAALLVLERDLQVASASMVETC